MKQTKQALTFTLAQYRAVFKNAYFKGLSVVVLGSSLSSMHSATATENDEGFLTLDSGDYLIKQENGTATITKNGVAFTLPEASGTSLIVLQDNGTLSLQGKISLNGTNFNVVADDPEKLGARIGFDGTQQISGSSFYNIVKISGENHIGEQLTIHSTTQLLNGDSGKLDVAGYMTISKGASGSDLSAVDISISPLAQGKKAGYGDLTLDPNITVGNLTFQSGSQSTDIDLYYDQSSNAIAGDSSLNTTGNSGERTISVVDNKKVVFETGTHNIKSSVNKSAITGTGPSLKFSGSTSTQVLNKGTLNVLRPVTFAGGIGLENTGTLITQSGSWEVEEPSEEVSLNNIESLTEDAGNAQSNTRIDKLGNITITQGSTFKNTGKIEIGANTVFSLDADAFTQGVTSIDKNQDSKDASTSPNDVLTDATGQLKFIDLNAGLGDFTNKGKLVLKAPNTQNDYIFTSSVESLKVLGVDLTQDLTDEQATSKPALVLDNTALQVKDDLSLNSNRLASLSGAASLSGGMQAQLQTTGKINFTTQSTGIAEDLHGLALVGKQLNFISGKTDSSDSQSILISGSGEAPLVFGASQSLTSQNNQALNFNNASLHLQDFATVDNSISGAQGNVQVDLSFAGSGSELLVADRAWTAKNISLNSGSKLTLEANHNDVGLTAQDITLSADSSMELNGGSLKVKSLMASGSVSGSNVNLEISGNGQVNSVEFTTGNNFKLQDSTINFNNAADTINLRYVPDSNGGNGRFEIDDAQKFTGNNVVIKLDVDQVSGLDKLSVAEANSLLQTLTTEGSSGFVSLIGDLTPDLPVTNNTTTGEKEVSFEEIAGGGTLHLDFDTEQSRSSRLTNVSGQITGGWMGVQTSSGNVSVANSGTLALYGPKNEQFAQDANGQLVGIQLGAGATLNFNGQGKVGSISGETATLNVQQGASVSVVDSQGQAQDISIASLKNHGQLTVGSLKVTSLDLTAQSSLQASNLNLSDALNASGASLKVTETADLGQNASLSASTLEAKNVNSDALQLTNSSLIKIADTLNANKIELTGNSVLQATNIKLDQNGELRIGVNGSNEPAQDDSESGAGKSLFSLLTSTNNDASSSTSGTEDNSGNNSPEDTPDSDNATSAGSGSAHVIAGNINLNGGRLILDPGFKQNTATLFAKSIGGADISTATTKDSSQSLGLMKIDGDIIIGRNSALGLSSDADSQEAQKAFSDALAAQQTNGSLSEKGIGAYLYIDRAGIDLNGHRLLMTTDDVDKLLTNRANVSDADIYLGSGAGIQVTAKALNEAGDETIFVNLGSDTSLESQGGQVLVPANVSAEQFTKIFGKQISFVEGSSLTVMTENGLYSATITTEDALHGNFKLNLSDNARQILSYLSDPTYDYLTNVLSTNTAYYATQSDFADALNKEESGGSSAFGTNGVAVVEDSLGYQFIQDMAGAKENRALEQSARLITFGGGMQSALMAVDTTNNAINSRLGFGAAQLNGSVMPGYAECNLWATPVYKYQSSSGFAANNLDYGVDANLYGAVLGMDVGFSNGLRLGGVFNLGQGDADGQEIGAGVKNDFDYYGFGLYMGFNPHRNVLITADTSYTISDNDVQASVGVKDYDKLTASAKTTAFSLGLGAQATMKSSVDITPHIGLRYTHLNMDDYHVKLDGKNLANISSDSANIFSVPLGVSLSKEFRDGDLIIKPFVDLNMTANFGDTDVASSSSYSGIYGAEVRYNTELMDDITYGAKLGLDVQQGNFRFGVKAGYTGSSHVDDYSVSADVRLVF